MNDSPNLKNALAFVGSAFDEINSIYTQCDPQDEKQGDFAKRLDWAMGRLMWAIGSINNERQGV